MSNYKERVVIEKDELNTKINDLVGFMHSDEFVALDSVNQGLLMVQHVAMQNYIDVLRRRIEVFKD